MCGLACDTIVADVSPCFLKLKKLSLYRSFIFFPSKVGESCSISLLCFSFHLISPEKNEGIFFFSFLVFLVRYNMWLKISQRAKKVHRYSFMQYDDDDIPISLRVLLHIIISMFQEIHVAELAVNLTRKLFEQNKLHRELRPIVGIFLRLMKLSRFSSVVKFATL